MFRPGDVVGGAFRVCGLLGEGGMAQVWEAHDLQLDRRVALKAARPHASLPPLWKEAQALAAFHHPSLVTVHALGQHRDVDFIVLERIVGVSLGELLYESLQSRQPFSLGEALGHMRAIAEGLAVVHREGLAHWDVKPDNVMLTPDGRVVLMDFGLVLPEYESEVRSVIAGTPHYMSPESVRNEVAVGGGQLVDIYAFGVTCFELLTCLPPFLGDSSEELFAMHSRAPVPSVRARRRDVPAALDELVRAMLAKAPGDRPASMDAIAQELCMMEMRLQDPDWTPDLEPIDVLIVEDDEAMARVERFYVEDLFGRERVSVRTASDGEEALAGVRAQPPDLLLLDLQLPKLNGIEVGMQIRGDGLAPDAKFIGISAGAQEGDLRVLHRLGFHHFVPKGVGMRRRLAAALRPLFPRHLPPS